MKFGSVLRRTDHTLVVKTHKPKSQFCNSTEGKIAAASETAESPLANPIHRCSPMQAPRRCPIETSIRSKITVALWVKGERVFLVRLKGLHRNRCMQQANTSSQGCIAQCHQNGRLPTWAVFGARRLREVYCPNPASAGRDKPGIVCPGTKRNPIGSSRELPRGP